MAKPLEEQLREEVEKRKKGKTAAPKRYLRNSSRQIMVGCLSLGALIIAVKTLYSPVNLERMVPTLSNPKSNLQAIEPPESGIIKQYRPLEANKTGLLRFFAREPVDSDLSSLASSCKTTPNDSDISEDGIVEHENATENEQATQEEQSGHYYIELLDWESNEIVVTAFIRKEEMAMLEVPFGTYKIRYTSGLSWYGETDLFGYQTLYEMTEALPKRIAKFEVSDENLGADIGFHCSGGNLGRTPVDKDSSKKGIPVEPTDPIQSI